MGWKRARAGIEVGVRFPLGVAKVFSWELNVWAQANEEKRIAKKPLIKTPKKLVMTCNRKNSIVLKS
ncbi:hypothetical protein ACFFHF_11560 [Robertmurraya beringensis]|uniref:Uncharacterized protein n=1 Tax=Robertmurraya beringensis TaxID=641660 RepID=A0ABV6KRD7_9BACI